MPNALARFTSLDQYEQEYLDAKRGTMPDDELAENLRQYRAIKASDKQAAEAEGDEMYDTPPSAGPKPVSTVDSPPPTALPSLQEFLAEVGPKNPKLPTSQLAAYWNTNYGHLDPKTLPTLDAFLAEVKPKNPETPESDLREYWQDHYGALGALEKAPPERDFMRGVETALKQIPQLASGVEAGIGAVGEKVFGEGGVSTAIKEHGVKGYQAQSEKIDATARPSDSFTHSWEQAKQGNLGALVDFIQYGLGYVATQGAEMLATGGLGYAVGKLGLQGASKLVAEKLITKESARLSAAEGAKLTGEALAKKATENVAAKIGQTTAFAATATGMEGGEIFGDLTAQAAKEGRSLSGEELAKAFGATLAAGSLEFVGDKIGFDLLVGKSPVGKLASGMPGVAGRATRGAIQGATGATIEGGTEFGQTLIESAGKGKDPFSDASIKEAVDSAALGVVGGTAVGGTSGVLTGTTKPAIHPAIDTPKALPTEQIPAVVGVGDPSVGVDQAIANAYQMVTADLETEDVAAQEKAAEQYRRQAEQVAPIVGPARTRQPEEIPILPGAEPQPVPLIQPGTAFTPKAAPSLSPREALQAERERLLGMRRPVQETAQTPASVTPEGPLQSAQELAYPPEQRSTLPTQASIARRETGPVKRAGSEIPILQGPAAQPAQAIQPGQTFTAKQVPELTPRERLAQERARLLDMKEKRAQLPLAQPIEPPAQVEKPVEPPVETKAETPLKTMVDLTQRTPQSIHALAKEKGFDPESGTFREFSRLITGKAHLDDMTPEELEKVAKAIVKIRPHTPVLVKKPEKPPPPPSSPPGSAPVYQDVLSPMEAATIPRHRLAPEQNAEVLARAEKAEADMAIAGNERGTRVLTEVSGQGGTQEVTGLKSPTADWYRQATTGDQALSKQRVERAIAKIIKDAGADVGKDVQRVKQLLLQDQEFAKSPFAPKTDQDWQTLITTATGQPPASPPGLETTPAVPPSTETQAPTGTEAAPTTDAPFILTAQQAPKTKVAKPEQLSIDVPPPTVGEKPIIGREVDTATAETEAPLFSAAAKMPDDVQTSLPTEAEAPTTILANALRSAADQIELGQAPSSKDLINSPERHAEFISNLLVREPFKSQGFGGLKIPMQRKVLGDVFAAAQDLKIREAIISSIPVDMVDYLRRQQLSPNALFDNKAVFEKLLIPSASSTNVSGRVEMADALVRITAREIAKFINAPGIKRSSESGSAVSAGYGSSPSPLTEPSTSLAAELSDLGVVDAPGKSTTTLKAREGHGSHSTSGTISNVGGEGNKSDTKETDTGTALFSRDLSQTNTPAFKNWFRNSKVVDENGKPLPVYHGTRRADRITGRFLKNRATSGPMAFFTATPDMASKYATGKQDTSIALEDRPYKTWFTIKPEGARSPVDIAMAWYRISPEERARIATLAPRVGKTDDGEQMVLHDADHKSGIGGYDQHIKEAHGNHLLALVDEWLNSGALFNEEEEFAQVLKLAGLTRPVVFDDPHAEHPGVIPVYLSIQNPLVTSRISEKTIQALEEAGKRKRAPRQTIGADPWDKATRDPKEWLAQLREDTAQGKNSFVWSSIPDWVTDSLKAEGFDGIHDAGGKMGGVGHDVWIPFEETQVKSSIGNKGTFDPTNRDIRFSRAVPTDTTAEKLADLNEAMQRTEGIGNAFKYSPEGDQRMIDAFESVFGVTVIPIKNQNPRALGFLSVHYHGTLFVGTDARHGFVQMAGHELLHHIQEERPELYAWFNEQATTYLRADSEGRYAKRLAATGAYVSEIDVRQEILADFVGDALADPQFLQRLADANPSKFRSFVNTVLDWLKEVASKLTHAGFGSSQYFTDVEALRDSLGSVLEAYREGDAGAIGELSFSRRMESKTPLEPGVMLLHDEPFDLKDIKNRRFMFNPTTGEMVLGGERREKGFSHAEEHRESGAVGQFDDFIRGWVGTSKEYPSGVVHFAPPIEEKYFREHPDYADEVMKTLEFLAHNGATKNTVLRSVPGAREQKFGESEFSPLLTSKRNGMLFRRDLKALGDLSPAQTAALEQVHGTLPTWQEKLNAFKSDWKRTLTQGLLDQFAPILDYSKKGYILSRLAKGGDGTLEALLLYGKPYVDKDGAYRVDYKEETGMNGFSKVLAGLHGEQDRFLEWVAALRAEKLTGEGRENLYDAKTIAELKSLNQGTMKDGTKRPAVYEKALLQMHEWNAAMVKIGVESGLLNRETAKLFKDEPYVPFYRVLDEDHVNGFGHMPGLVNQFFSKKLKGGKEKLNQDLLANVLQNWSHILTASAKNRAAKETLEAAVQSGVAEEVPNGTPGKGLVHFMDDGKARTFTVSDPALMDAIAALHYAGLGSIGKPFQAAKRALTIGVTVNPAYKARNLIRDTIQAIGTSQLSANPLKNIAQGMKATRIESETRAQMLAGGGMIRFGSMLDGNNASRTRRLIESGVDPESILDNASKIERFFKQRIMPAFDAYQELGDRGEQVNRAALFEQLQEKGLSNLEANFWARDLMDFQLMGKWEAVRILAQVVPFANSRLQGLYKIGRAGKEDYRRMATTLGAVSLASLGLLLAYHDDDDWKKRDEWDKDNYWWFRIGETAVRIPKPFELGAIGTLVERGAQLMFDDEMTGAKFRDRVGALIASQLSMNPTPQLFKPLIDIYANKDSFTERQIETEGMQRLRKEDRYTDRTSEMARLMGSLGVPDPTKLAMGKWDTLSPVQIDSLVHAYFGWVGTSANTVLDYGIRPLVTRGEKPAMQLKDVFLAGNFVESLPTNSSRYVTTLYETAKSIEESYGSYRDALKRGETERAKDIFADEKDKIVKYHQVEGAKRSESAISAQIRMIERSDRYSSDEKRQRINQLKERQHLLAMQFSRRQASVSVSP